MRASVPQTRESKFNHARFAGTWWWLDCQACQALLSEEGGSGDGVMHACYFTSVVPLPPCPCIIAGSRTTRATSLLLTFDYQPNTNYRNLLLSFDVCSYVA